MFSRTAGLFFSEVFILQFCFTKVGAVFSGRAACAVNSFGRISEISAIETQLVAISAKAAWQLAFFAFYPESTFRERGN
jgi:hypothetical protein